VFQIKDDILGIYSEEKKTGKPQLSDLQEAKKTLLFWFAYHNSSPENKAMLKKIYTKPKVNETDLAKIRKIFTRSGALDYAKQEMATLQQKAKSLIQSTKMQVKYKQLLQSYSQKLLKL
ncbi:MAG: polyprenyl synthetase family protein, partial [Omnitrophica bacterium]|nr:polyprenyl synthetase family protein [Candidatus Omnitrophota bacterium]